MSGKHLFFPHVPSSPIHTQRLSDRVGQMAKCPGSDGGYDTFFTTSGHFLVCLQRKESVEGQSLFNVSPCPPSVGLAPE